jgi:hypothetical protein
LARQLVADGVVGSISPDTVGRILNNHRLKRWRHHLWLSPKVQSGQVIGELAGHVGVGLLDDVGRIDPAPSDAAITWTLFRRTNFMRRYSRLGGRTALPSNR